MTKLNSSSLGPLKAISLKTFNMKNFNKLITAGIFLFGMMAFTSITRMVEAPAMTNPIKVNEIELLSNVKLEAAPIEINLKTRSNFLDDLGMRESSNNYKAVNKYGYLGKYQFGKKTLKGLGYKISANDFLNNPRIQEEAMIKLLLHNKKVLKRQIKKYDGEMLHGVYITESGLLAAAHLAGPGNVKKWIRSGKDFEDGLGTKMTSYLKQFGNYQLIL